MRIATLANAAVVHTRRWVEHFRARGHQVRVWSLEPGPEPLAAERLPALPLPGFLRYPLAAPAVRAALDGFGPDLVDAHYVPNYGLLGVLSGRRPLVVTAWGSDLLIAGRRDPLQRARARFVLARADAVLADARNLADAAIALGAPAARVHCLPWGVDRARFAPRGPRTAGLIASTRMHEPVYGIDTVIDAAATVLADRPSARIVFAGGGSRTAELEARAGARLPAGRWRFAGRLEPRAMAELLAEAEVFVSASHSDSTSVSLLEAMASGAVPVVSDIGGNREWVSEGDGARLFPPGDPAALARALAAALDDRAWADAARVRNARVVAERGDWHANLAAIERLFEALAGAAGPAGARP
jgi:glycosyltransferase involved in cell wall biosynthesis